MSAGLQYGGPRRRKGEDRVKRASICSFRIDSQFKESLQSVARKQGRTLSSLIERALHDYLDSCESNSPRRKIQEDRRHHLRKKVLLPARWRISEGEDVVECDVLVKDISAGGAYTEYVNGENFELIKTLKISPFALVIRIPGSAEPVVLDCKASRIYITGNHVGAGLRFTKNLSDFLRQCESKNWV